MYKNEPFIFASQAEQVFYVQDPVDNAWHVVIKTTPRDYYDMIEDDSGEDVESYLQSTPCTRGLVDGNSSNNEDNVDWVRKDMDGTFLNIPLPTSINPNDDQLGDSSRDVGNTQNCQPDEWHDY